MNHYVYKITNLINNKKYIGKRSCDCDIKDDQYMGSGIILKKAIKKYGKDNFKKDIIEILDNEEEAFQREMYWIKYFNAVRSKEYYNLKDGGNGNTSADAIRNNSNLTSKQREMKKRKLSMLKKGANNPMYGKYGKENPTSKNVLMIDFTGQVIKEFESLRLTNDYFQKNKAYSVISKVCINKTGVRYDHLWLFKEDYLEMVNNNTYDDWIINMNNTCIKRFLKVENTKNSRDIKAIYQLEKNTYKVVNKFENLRDIKEKLNLNIDNINKVCNYEMNSAYGYVWVYQIDFDNLSLIEIKNKFNKIINKKVICLNDKKVFNNVELAREYYNLSNYKNIYKACEGIFKSAGRDPVSNKPLKWMYYKDYINTLKICA